jgi:hypothetical protein
MEILRDVKIERNNICREGDRHTEPETEIKNKHRAGDV